MPVGSPQTKVNFDSTADDPIAAFAELAANVDTFNTLVNSLLKECAELSVGEGLQNASGSLALLLSTDAGLEINTNQLRAKLQSNSGLVRGSTGLAIEFANLTELTSLDGALDWLQVWDASSNSRKKINGNNLGGTGGQEIFSASGTWVKPASVSRVHVLCIGGGGGGGLGNGGNGGGGGGGGGYIEAVVNVSGDVAVTIGVGGSGGSSGTGGVGGNTFFGSLVTAVGGNGGFDGAGGGLGGAGGAGSSTGQLVKQLRGVTGAPRSGTVGGEGRYHALNNETAAPGGATGNNPGGNGVNYGDSGGGAGHTNTTRSSGFQGLCIISY